MLLQRLKDYADERMTLPPPLYTEAPVRYILDLDATGRLLNRRPTDTADKSSRATERGQRHLVPQVQRAVGVKPLLLADNSEYTLGLARETSRPARVAQCHEAYLDVLRRCAAATGEAAVGAVLRFLDDDPAGQLDLPDDYDRGATVSFAVDGVFPFQLPSVQAFWAAEHDPASAANPAPVMQCVVCGQERPALDRLQGKIKGVPGGQTSGTAIISANAKAFESYGLEASLIAPTCADCGERFTKAANELLAKRESRITLGGAAFIFWTREDVAFDFYGPITNPDAEQVRELLESVRSGKRLPRVDDTAFYATALSGSGGRAVVRDWIDTTVGEVRQHLGQWFRRQAIVDAYGEAPRPLGLYALAAATVRDANKDLAPPTPRALLRSALTGTPLPPDLLYEAVRRNRAEQAVTRPRAALIKLVLCSQLHYPASEEETMVQLNEEHTSAAYHCGRLLAVLEQAQEAAIDGIKQTIVDRFLGTASSAPAAVFPRLLQGARPHLTKLKRDRPATGMALQRRIEEVMGHLAGFPRTLKLEEQGLFALGYYHQRAHDRAQAREAAARRRSAEPGAPDATKDDDTNDAAAETAAR